MKRLIVGFLAVVGALALVVLVAAIAGGIWFTRQFTAGPELPERIVLTLDLGEPLVETVPGDPLATIGLEQPLELGEIVLALERAAADPRVRGLVARLDATDHGMAVAQELRATIDRFRAGGRFARAWADSFGELGPGNEGYYIATAFDEIHLQPGGMVGLTGLLAEIPFVRPLLDRLGIQAEVIRRSDYKTAFDSLVEDGLTAAHAEMMNDLLDQIYAALVDGVAASRGLAPAEVERLIDAGPFTGEAALAAGLVDGLAFRDEVLDRALAEAGPGSAAVGLAAYARAEPESDGEPPATVALIVAQGTIQRGTAGFDAFIGADDLAAQLAEARDDDAIDAVVLRLDTGGGSAVASETIGREVELLRQAGKPIVVSMGNAAASGGYWIAMGASHIVAEPATLTGSIGVIAGKPVLAGLWEQLGVNWATLQRGENAGYLSLNRPFDALARERLERAVGALYERFKAGVAEGRGLPPNSVEALAQGRVWLGSEAVGLGLVDELGGILEARAAAARLLELPAGSIPHLQRYPEPPSTFERLRELFDQPSLPGLASLIALWHGALLPGTAEITLPRFR
ncbi:MAG: S49 family peptidase [Geminicoccaceae bacterium]|nr:S49 family peptidase [Geminicoccaceae bacterium]MCB9969621.1 S49 family peptidase [Geminicoccaceae bacterium]HRY24199.1 S49 family peptidase [Geminicoccaceae bacterium]